MGKIETDYDCDVALKTLAGVTVLCSWARNFTLIVPLSAQGPVVQRMDNAIHWINLTIQWISVDTTDYAIRWIVIYPVDSVIHPLNNQAQEYKWVPTKYCGLTCDGLALIPFKRSRGTPSCFMLQKPESCRH